VVAADAIGLAGVPPDERNPFLASSRGLAAPVLGAVAAGAAHVIVFVGGTANMDGGIGFLAGLGADIQDADGAPLAGTGADLDAVRSLDLTAAYRSLQGVRLTLATDVSSPLSGPGGAAEVFGPQKGATPDGVRRLDRGLRALTRLLGPAAEQPGAGAAGGLGAALMALGAEQTSGADYVLRLTDFRQRLRGVDLCVTAEGSVDRSTAVGKAVSAVLRACQSVGVPCAVLGGMIDPDADELYAQGAAGLFAIGRRPRPLADALSATADDLARTTRAVCSLAAVGR
jgi:glycerate kinase